MAGSMTPRRRRRDEDEDDSDHGGSSTHSKRARTQSPEQPLLPDNFLRSPNGHNNTASPGKHQPGSIVRVTLTNFVTYTKAEFLPGPNLNMIIGPNGTGKSTLVCAICLGLAWSANHLGRAKLVGEFVKHGAKEATIEIELAADPERHRQNPVITTRINRAQKNPEFQIDGKKSNKARVLEMARSFSIQVDNLCQFLPQDRVVEFAALSPVDLLTQTQRAAAPEYMCEWHDQLKAMRKEQKTQLDDQQRVTEDLKQLEQRHRLQEGDVVRLRERQQLLERIAALQKLRPFPEYTVAKQKHKEAKDRRKAAEKELNRLERQVQPNLVAEEDKKHYFERVGKTATSRRNLLGRMETTADTHLKKQKDTQEKIDECATSITEEQKIIKDARGETLRHETAERNLQRAMDSAPPDFDPAAYNEKIREKTRRLREVTDQMGDIKTQVDSLGRQGEQRNHILANLEREKDSLQTQAGQQANKLKHASRDAAQAWDWIQNNRDQFQGDVYGPPIVECSVTDPRHAGAVESMVQAGELLAFTVTSRADFQKLTRVLYTELRLSNISVRTSIQPLNYFRPPCSTEQLQATGLQSWLIDLLEGPEPVLAMLCDNRMLHQTGFSDRDFSDAERKALEQGGLISSWVTPSESCLISRRRDYGPAAVSTRTNRVRPARFFTDAPVDHGQESDIDRRIKEVSQETDDLKQQIIDLKAQNVHLNDQRKTLTAEEADLKREKNDKQRQQAEFAGLPTKLEQTRNRMRDASEKIKSSRQRQLEILVEGDKLTLDKGQYALDYASAVNTLRELHVQVFEAEIVAIEAKSDLQQLQARTADERRMLEECRAEVDQLTRVTQELLTRGQELRAQCEAIGPLMENDETLRAVYDDEVSTWDPDQLETEYQSSQAKLDMNDGPSGGQRVLQEYEERGQKIERRRTKLVDVEASLQKLESSITDIREKWEPQLDQLVAHISEAFAENFSKIQCAGEVAVYKDEDFELWAIQIKVKFRYVCSADHSSELYANPCYREYEQLSILDSHRQSGGERAVSTIFYLMALQSLARAPFRVVDEINQGMDPRNERLVHSRMVEIACSENSASQCFLITPKLLNGLKYHPSMKVHCIASGEYMPEDHRDLDFGMLAQRALAMRGERRGGPVAAAG